MFATVAYMIIRASPTKLFISPRCVQANNPDSARWERDGKKPPNRTPQIILYVRVVCEPSYSAHIWGGHEDIQACWAVRHARFGPTQTIFSFLLFFLSLFSSRQSCACDWTYREKSGGYDSMHGQMRACSGHAGTASRRVRIRIEGRICLVCLYMLLDGGSTICLCDFSFFFITLLFYHFSEATDRASPTPCRKMPANFWINASGLFFAIQRGAAYICRRVCASEFPQTGCKAVESLRDSGPSPRRTLTTLAHPKLT